MRSTVVSNVGASDGDTFIRGKHTEVELVKKNIIRDLSFITLMLNLMLMIND